MGACVWSRGRGWVRVCCHVDEGGCFENHHVCTGLPVVKDNISLNLIILSLGFLRNFNVYTGFNFFTHTDDIQSESGVAES